MAAKKSGQKSGKPRAMKGKFFALTDEAKAALERIESSGFVVSTFVSNAIVAHANSDRIKEAIETLTGTK